MISQNPDFEGEGAFRVTSIDRAFGLALTSMKDNEAQEIMIIGGGAIYDQLLDNGLVCRIYKTQIHMLAQGDTFFRPSERIAQTWICGGFAPSFLKAGPKDQADMSFIVLEKPKKAQTTP